MNDWLLFAWLLADLVWSSAILTVTGYLVFFRGQSGWWFVFALLLSYGLGGSKLYRALAKRFGVRESADKYE